MTKNIKFRVVNEVKNVYRIEVEYDIYNQNSNHVTIKTSSENIITCFIEIDIRDYRNKLINEFNGRFFIDQVYFRKKKDIDNAIDWVNGLYILNQLK